MSGAAGFKDHFSGGGSDSYARYRPSYPAALFDFLADAAPGRGLAWDCATGTGQAALELAGRFDAVHASDASADQVAAAVAHPRVRYAVEAAEACGLADGSADLVTVAQALHWFDLPGFYREVRRVLRPGGIVAAWSYGRLSVDPAVSRVVGHFYRDVVGPWWPPERKLVESGYAGLDFPFAPVTVPELRVEAAWNLTELLGYLATWSATRRYREALGRDPLDEVRGELAAAWGDPATVRPAHWPLVVLCGRV